jgi:hypothetical protein
MRRVRFAGSTLLLVQKVVKRSGQWFFIRDPL